MKEIDIGEIDLINLKKIYESEDAKTYRDDDTVYKIFNEPERSISRDHARKARVINKYRKRLDKHIILPRAMIVYPGCDTGYTSKLIKNSFPLYDFELNSPAAIRQFYSYLYEVCRLLKNLHRNGIVVSDFHFHNVLYRKKEVFMVDFDNAKVDCLEGYATSYLFGSFVDLYRLPFDFETISEETDRLSLLLSTLQMFCKERTIFLTDERYADLCNKYTLVNNIIAELKRIIRQREIRNVPLPTDLMQLKKRP